MSSCAVQCAHRPLGSEEMAVALSASKENEPKDRSCSDGGVAVDSNRNLVNPDLAMFWGWDTPQVWGLAPPAVGFDGLLSLHSSFQGLKHEPLHWILVFCFFFLMDHHCFSFLMAQFENWVFFLEGPSFLCLWLLPFVTSEVSPALLSHIQGCLSHGAHQTLALQNQVIKAGLGFFPCVFQYLPKSCPCQVWFSHSGSLGGFTGSDEPCPCEVIPWEWGWSQGCSAALLLSQNNPAGCIPDPVLPVPADPAVVRLDFSLAGEADRLPCQWGPCEPFMGSLKFLNSATDAFLERPQFKGTCYKDTQHMKDLLLFTQNCFPLIHRSLFPVNLIYWSFFPFFFSRLL